MFCFRILWNVFHYFREIRIGWILIYGLSQATSNLIFDKMAPVKEYSVLPYSKIKNEAKNKSKNLN